MVGRRLQHLVSPLVYVYFKPQCSLNYFFREIFYVLRSVSHVQQLWKHLNLMQVRLRAAFMQVVP